MQKKKSGVKKCLEICAIKGGGGVGGVGRLMANAISNFHFDFLHTSLMFFKEMITQSLCCKWSFFYVYLRVDILMFIFMLILMFIFMLMLMFIFMLILMFIFMLILTFIVKFMFKC